MFRNVGTIAGFICGGVLVAFGAGIAPSIVPAGTVGVFVGAGLLMAIGAYVWFLMTMVINRGAARIVASPKGIEVTLRNKDVLSADWSAPAFAVDITQLDQSKKPKRLIWLTWRMRGRMTSTLITQAGSELIVRRASGSGVTSRVNSTGKPPLVYTTTELRGASEQRFV